MNQHTITGALLITATIIAAIGALSLAQNIDNAAYKESKREQLAEQRRKQPTTMEIRL